MMIVCICNGLNEQEMSKLTWEEYQEIKNCGTCTFYCKKLLTNSFRNAKRSIPLWRKRSGKNRT